MVKYKNFKFPKDLILIFKIFFLLLYYNIILNFVSVKKIINSINKNKIDKKIDYNYEIKLNKVRRICNFFLNKVYHSNRPCLRRSIILFRWCCQNGIKANLIIGVSKDGDKLKGHSWILINDMPYMENIEELSQYTSVMEG